MVSCRRFVARTVVVKTIYVAVGDMNARLTPSSASGFIIGLVGGVIDFASGAGLLLGGTQQTPMESTSVPL